MFVEFFIYIRNVEFETLGSNQNSQSDSATMQTNS